MTLTVAFTTFKYAHQSKVVEHYIAVHLTGIHATSPPVYLAFPAPENVERGDGFGGPLSNNREHSSGGCRVQSEDLEHNRRRAAHHQSGTNTVWDWKVALHGN